MKRPEQGARTLAAVRPIWAVAAAINAAAAIALATVLAPGISLNYGPVNAAYIAAHLGPWRAGWALWIAAAISLLGFFGWWGTRIGWPLAARVAFAIAALGVVADVTAEARLIAWSADLDVSGALRQSGIVANAGYSIAGGLLMRASGRRWRRGVTWWGWAVWVLGAGLSVAVALSSDVGSEVLSAAIFILLVPWLIAAGRTLS